MSAIIDTSVLVAYFNSRDERHEEASALVRRIASREFGAVMLSDYVFDETMTVLAARRVGKTAISELGEKLLASKEIGLVYANETVFRDAWHLFKKSEDLSFTDCIIAATARALNAKILSFDHGFKQLKGMETIP